MAKANKFMRQHQTLSVSQQFKKQMEQQCPRHNTNQLDLFCEDCNLSICSTCFSKEHNKHKCCGLEEKMETFSSEVDRVLIQTDRALEAIHNDPGAGCQGQGWHHQFKTENISCLPRHPATCRGTRRVSSVEYWWLLPTSREGDCWNQE